MSRKGTITLTCDRCREQTVEVKVTGLVRGIECIPVRSITIYPRMETHGWMFIDGEGDVCNACLTSKERLALSREVPCPHCEAHGLEGNVEFKNGRAHCKRHGCTLVAGEWIYLCEKCGAEVEHLYGWPTPYLCESCLDKAPRCGICGRPRPVCNC